MRNDMQLAPLICVHRYTLGQHGSPWTPASARSEAEELLRQVRKGIDVLHAKRDRERQARDLALKAYVTTFIDG